MRTSRWHNYFLNNVFQKITLKKRNVVLLLCLLIVAISSTSVNAFTSNRIPSRQIISPRITLSMGIPPKLSSKEDEEEFDRYNDDAFGLVFLAGSMFFNDYDFAGTFLAFSVVAATVTNAGILKSPDDRIPGLVALSTLALSPFVASLRSTGTLGDAIAPTPLEITVCLISFFWSIYKWKREQ